MAVAWSHMKRKMVKDQETQPRDLLCFALS
jgi:hypothetical protein